MRVRYLRDTSIMVTLLALAMFLAWLAPAWSR